MKEDKKLHSLLNNYGMQKPSAGFDDEVMKKIAAVKFDKASSTQLISPALKSVLVAAFVVVCLLLFVIALLVKPGIISNYMSISLSKEIYIQVFSFFAAFWIVMCLNIWWNYRGTGTYFQNE